MEFSKKDKTNHQDERLIDNLRPQFLYVKMNSSSQSDKKASKVIKVKISDNTDKVSEFISEDIVKKHMNTRGKNYPQAKLYNKNGVEIDGEDIVYMKTGDVVYLARHGEPFNYQQVMDRYEKLSKLGQGGFGKVYLMRDKEKPDQLYAVKVIDMSEYLQKADGIYEIDREAKTLRMLNSKYIIQLENYFIHGQKEVILVMEYAQGGELKQYLNRKGGRLGEFECQFLMRQIIAGMASCHQRGIIHRDLKLENVLFMDKECTHLKIVDFGIAGFCLNYLKEKTDSGTFKYMAPEVLKGDINLANPQMDIWALGIMMFLMLFGYHPFLNKKERITKDYDVKVLMQRIINDPVEIPQPTFPSNKDSDEVNLFKDTDEGFHIPIITDACRNLLSQLLHKNPKQRILLIDVQFHPWLDLTEDDFLQQHEKMLQKHLEDEAMKQEKQRLKFQKSLQKRNTILMPNGISGISNMFGKKSLGQTINGQNRKMSSLSPNDIMVKGRGPKEDMAKIEKKGGLKKASVFELEEARNGINKMSRLSPAFRNNQPNMFGFAEKR